MEVSRLVSLLQSCHWPWHRWLLPGAISGWPNLPSASCSPEPLSPLPQGLITDSGPQQPQWVLEGTEILHAVPSRVLQAVSRDQWLVMLDLRDAYLKVPVHPAHWQYLRFTFEGTAYEFMVLPFGLSLAPCTFTKCMDDVPGTSHVQRIVDPQLPGRLADLCPDQDPGPVRLRQAPDLHQWAGYYYK